MRVREIFSSFVVVFALSGLPGVLVAADAVNVGDIQIREPWARASIGTSRPAAAYLSITNGGSRSDRLLSLESSVVGHIEIHRSMSKDNVMRMEATGALGIPPGITVTLKPGGMHVMLMKLKKPLKRGESFPLVLQFEQAGRVELEVPIFGPGAVGPE